MKKKDKRSGQNGRGLDTVGKRILVLTIAILMTFQFCTPTLSGMSFAEDYTEADVLALAEQSAAAAETAEPEEVQEEAASQEEAAQNGLLMDKAHLKALFERLSAEDTECGSCFNRFHCARGCPDVCPALTPETRDAGSFRCRISRKLAEAELFEIADVSLNETARRYGFAGVDLRGE